MFAAVIIAFTVGVFVGIVAMCALGYAMMNDLRFGPFK